MTVDFADLDPLDQLIESQVQADIHGWTRPSDFPDWVPAPIAAEAAAFAFRRRGGHPSPIDDEDDPAPAAQAPAAPALDSKRLQAGGAFVFDQPDGVPAVWGLGDEVLWSVGEALWIVGPPGVGKTTVVGQLVRGRLGLASEAIAWPIKAGSKRALYLAMDRPAQIARALRRHFTQDERQVLDEKLIVWKGPPPADVAKNLEEVLA